jgi:hypothetical protein
MIYYYKRYKVTGWGTFWAFIIGCLLTGIVQKAVIQWTIKGAGAFDVLFVNSFGLPFFTGFGFFFVFIGALIFVGLKLAKSNNWNFLKLGLWSFAFMVLGTFSSYFTTMVRSNANTSVDMYNVDNPISLVGYLGREQYGDWPILYGQDFTAKPIDSKETATYVKSGDKYEKNGRKVEYEWAPEDMHFLPRMWDQSNDQGHADYYANWAGINRDKEGTWDGKPTMADNISYAFGYQLNWMYIRYFMWNFAGKQNDVQGIYTNNVRDGNWKTGIGFLDTWRLGDQSKLPDSLKTNKANNKLYALPLILGILGLLYQTKNDKRNAFVVGLLFILTGAAIVFYLNQAGNQPRERDYAFVGSFYAFAIWIGLGVLSVKELLSKLIKNNSALAGYAAAGICTLAVPVLMASQEWDDHDRSKKLIARDLATDYLESCAPNAIVISYGDNDTYPLWYAIEVEGIRPDIRVINSSLLGTDWYINQLRYKLYDSDPVDPIWTPEQIEGSNRDIVYYNPKAGVDPNVPMDLYTLMKDWAGSDDPSKTATGRDGSVLNIYPTKKVSIPVNVSLVKANGTVNANDSVLSSLDFEIKKDYLYKNDAAILNIIASNKWKRPIYFTSEQASDLGFSAYVRQDGLTHRLVPVKPKENQLNVNEPWAYNVMMNKFKFGAADVGGTYFDEENRRHLNSIRLAYAQVAGSLAENGNKDSAKQMLQKCDKMMLQENMPYGLVSRGQMHNQFSIMMADAAYKAGDTALADKIGKAVKKDLEQQIRYMEGLSESRQEMLQSYDGNRVTGLLQYLQQLEMRYKQPEKLQEMMNQIQNDPQKPKSADSNKKRQ